MVNFEGLGKEIARPPLLQQDGYVQLPKTPGLGIDLDEEALRAHSYEHFRPRNIRQYHEEPLTRRQESGVKRRQAGTCAARRSPPA